MDALLPLKTLYVTALGLALIVGLRTPSQVGRALRRMMLWMLLLPVGWAAVHGAWAALPFGERLLVLGAGVPAAALALLVGTGFGREVLASVFGNALYDGLRSRGCALGCLPLVALVLVLLALLG